MASASTDPLPPQFLWPLTASAALLLVGMTLAQLDWVSAAGVHTALEASSTLLALWIGVLALVRYYSCRLTPYQVLGAGFIGTAVLDGFHLLATSSWFAESLPSAYASTVGWSWLMSRMFLGLVSLLVYWAWHREQSLGEAGRIENRRYYWAVGLLVLVAFLVIATVPLPQVGRAGALIRPAELAPATLFLLAYAWISEKRRASVSHFDSWLGWSLLIAFAGHALFMSRSAQPFDAFFDAAHVLKLVSYGLVLTGLMVSVYMTYRRVDSAAAELQEANDALQAEVIERQRREDELRLAKEQAEEASRAKSQFLANMSHELRTPLNSVIGFAGIVHKNKAGTLGDKEIYYLDRILDNGKHLLGLINDVLDLSKIEAGRVELELAEVAVHDLVPQVLSQFESLVRETDVQLRLDMPKRLRSVRGDEARLKQVMVNLVGNAVKFTDSGSVTLRVIADEDKRPVRLDVVDTGVGIPRGRVEAVFASFTQADVGNDRQYEGTGLGLTISRSLCREMGFDLTAASVQGEGSTFSLLFDPAYAPPTHGEHHGRPAQVFFGVEHFMDNHADRDKFDGALALIIDDNRDCQTLIRHYAEETGCRVMICSSGQEGLELARRHRPDVIVLDLMMPAMDGWQVMRRLESDPELRSIAVIVVSIVGRESQNELTHATAILNKPVERHELFEALNATLDRGTDVQRRVAGAAL